MKISLESLCWRIVNQRLYSSNSSLPSIGFHEEVCGRGNRVLPLVRLSWLLRRLAWPAFHQRDAKVLFFSYGKCPLQPGKRGFGDESMDREEEASTVKTKLRYLHSSLPFAQARFTFIFSISMLFSSKL